MLEHICDINRQLLMLMSGGQGGGSIVKSLAAFSEHQFLVPRTHSW